MKTIIETITNNEAHDWKIFAKASEFLKAGGLVAFPTETVYGLGADTMQAEAAKKIYAAKGRPSDNPLIVHIADEKALRELAAEVPDTAITLARRFWPGPLTMIFKKRPEVPDTITGGLDTVAIRMPSHPTAARLIRESGVYIAAPSANISGKPSPTLAKHVIDDMKGRIDMIIADDTVDIGLESTIVDMSAEVPMVLRPGYISLAQLRTVLGNVVMDKAVACGEQLPADVKPKAPGMKYRHYAPKAPLTIVRGTPDNMAGFICGILEEASAYGDKVGVITTDEHIHCFTGGIVESLGSRSDGQAIARNLFAALRKFDEREVDIIYSESFDDTEVGQAVMNRLIKAAGHNIIEV